MALLPNYYKWILDLLNTWIGSRILDVGSGVGHFAERLPRWEQLVLLDVNPAQCEEMAERFRGVAGVTVCCQDILNPSILALGRDDFDTVICLDVLEHLADDEKALRHFHALLIPGGHLLLKVPAHPWLYGAMDVASGHFRRYARSALGELASRTGFEVVAMSAMNPLAVLPWLFKGRIRKRDVNFSRTFSATSLKRINRLIPLLRFLDRVWPFPLGLSWVAALQKPRSGGRQACSVLQTS
jgi:SAM-dependent methyltransferase